MTTQTEPSDPPDAEILAVCARFGNDPHRMLDILLAIQKARRWISPRSRRRWA